MCTAEVRQRKGKLVSSTQNDAPSPARRKKKEKTCCDVCLQSLKEAGLYFGLPTVIAILIFVIWPCSLEPETFEYPLPREFTGVLERNQDLAKGERLFENEISGPESIVVHEGHIYTGTADGKILDIYGDTIKLLVTLGDKLCLQNYTEETCGRPLGIRLLDKNTLVVVDAYLGLYSINIKQQSVAQLYSCETEIDGKRPRMLNDLAIGNDGMIYFSESSTKWTRKQFLFQGIENKRDGRILKYDPKTKSTSVACDGLYNPNGVELSHDGNFLVINEISRVRISRCYLSGPKSGSIDLFLDNTPGYPDNIRRSQDGGYWVALTAVRQADKQPFFEKLGPYPWLRTQLYKWMSLTKNDNIQKYRQYLPGSQTKKSAPKPRKSYGMIIKLHAEGDIIRSYHDDGGKIVGISHVEETADKILYLGSASNPYMASLDLKLLD